MSAMSAYQRLDEFQFIAASSPKQAVRKCVTDLWPDLLVGLVSTPAGECGGSH